MVFLHAQNVFLHPLIIANYQHVLPQNERADQTDLSHTFVLKMHTLIEAKNELRKTHCLHDKYLRFGRL